MPYELKEEEGGIIIELHSYSMKDLFVLSCYAWHDAVVGETDSCSIDEREISLKCINKEDVLRVLLTGINSLLFEEGWLFNSVDLIEVSECADSFDLHAVILGELFDESIHHLRHKINSIVINEIMTDNGDEEFGCRINISF